MKFKMLSNSADAAIVSLLLLLCNASAKVTFKKVPHVKLSENGELQGKVENSRGGRPYSSFIGIPYASVKERFAEAELFSEPSWTGVKSAVEPGPICVQADFWGSSGKGYLGEEDCLNLNVYVPLSNNEAKKKLPVMVWIHGGGYVMGSGIEQGPQFFMDEDVILVTINYRLGIFGFLSTADDVVPGNNGLKDIVVALRWIQKHITDFSGDPNKITIFGQSAGAAAVHCLLLSPTTKGLIHRAISQSGASVAVIHSHTVREAAVDLAVYMNCPTNAQNPSEISSDEILSCFKKAEIAELNKAELSFKSSWPMNLSFPFNPVIESMSVQKTSSLTPFLKDSPYATLTNRNVALAEIPWMVGMTEDEGACIFSGYVLAQQNLIKDINSIWKEIAPGAFDFERQVPKDKHGIVAEKVRKFYFGSKAISLETRDELTHIYSDYILGYSVYKSAMETAARKNNNVFLYQYAWTGPQSISEGVMPCIPDEDKKVIHSDDIIHQFIISHMIPKDKSEISVVKRGSDHETFSKNFVKLWASFAEHGEPRHSWGNSPNRKWMPVSKEEVDGNVSLKWYRIDGNPGHLGEDPYKERMAFWDSIYKEHLETYFLSGQNQIHDTLQSKVEL